MCVEICEGNELTSHPSEFFAMLFSQILIARLEVRWNCRLLLLFGSDREVGKFGGIVLIERRL